MHFGLLRRNEYCITHTYWLRANRIQPAQALDTLRAERHNERISIAKNRLFNSRRRAGRINFAPKCQGRCLTIMQPRVRSRTSKVAYKRPSPGSSANKQRRAL
jgi:hypothetical protein